MHEKRNCFESMDAKEEERAIQDKHIETFVLITTYSHHAMPCYVMMQSSLKQQDLVSLFEGSW